MPAHEIVLLAKAARELAQFYSGIKARQSNEEGEKQERLKVFADHLNQALITESLASGLATVIEAFRISATETGKQIISICRNELSGYLSKEDIIAAAGLFPARGKPVTFHEITLSEDTCSPHPLFDGYLLTNANQLMNALLREDIHSDWVPLRARDSIGATESDIQKRNQLMMERLAAVRAYSVHKDVIRKLVREWRYLLEQTEEEIRRLRQRGV